MKISSPLPGSGGNAKTLAQVLAAGAVPLPEALRYATEIAAALRELHEQGRTHGRVTAAGVLLGRQGAQLLGSRTTCDQGDTSQDTREFGALLYYLLTGVPLRPGESATPARRPGPRNSPAGLRTSALQVAADCCRPADQQPSMQQVLTELRLLAVLLRMPDQGEAADSRARPPAAPAPFLVAPVHFPLNRRRGQVPERVPVPEPSEEESETAPPRSLGPAAFGQPEAKAPAEVSPRGGPCPKCDSPTVYVSRARSRFEQWMTRMKISFCRCHSCYHRYFLFSRFKIAKEMPVKPEHKRRPHRRKR